MLKTCLLPSLLTLVALALSVPSRAAPEDLGNAYHPSPKHPSFLSPDQYEEFKKELPPPPTAGSPAQALDEKRLTELQDARTPQECEAARSEVRVSLAAFYGKPYGPLSDDRIARLTPFFEQVRNDADYFIQKLKVDYPRKRPFLYISSLNPCVPKEVTGAYPSGHAALSKLFALILADMDGVSRSHLDARASEIGKHRILSGMHHPSDVEAGRELATLIYGALKKSKKYKDAFAQAVAGR